MDLAENASGGAQERAAAVLATQPPLHEISVFYWNAFIELNSERPIGMSGSGLIPLTAIRAYAQDYDLDRQEYETFKRIIGAVDNRRQRLIDDKREKEAAKNKKAS
ncbi:phage tail assembly chaperone [Aurantiacibacter arachoides]